MVKGKNGRINHTNLIIWGITDPACDFEFCGFLFGEVAEIYLVRKESVKYSTRGAYTGTRHLEALESSFHDCI
jgi:hypothetical protein